MTEIFRTTPAVPGLNGEPYYDGMEDAEPGSTQAARYCRSAMYGSVLSGGLAGHIYGAGGWQGGLWSGEVEAASKYPIWEVLQWPSAGQTAAFENFCNVRRKGISGPGPFPPTALTESIGPREISRRLGILCRDDQSQHHTGLL